MVFANTLPFQAAAVAENIRRAVAKRAFIAGEETVALTVSIGIATTVTFTSPVMSRLPAPIELFTWRKGLDETKLFMPKTSS